MKDCGLSLVGWLASRWRNCAASLGSPARPAIRSSIGTRNAASTASYLTSCPTTCYHANMQSNPIVRVARSASLSEVVSRDLETRIRSGEFRPGSQMPSEKQLGTMLGVSRPVVREAVARLKADGFVETRQGAGMFVT